MHWITVFILVVTYLKCVQSGVDNRNVFSKKCITLGVKFYTATELEGIFKCCEDQFYKTPTNATAIQQAAKSCIINNSGNKATTALVLYNNINNCLDPESLDDLSAKLKDPSIALAKPLLKKIVNTVKNCKANTTIPAASRQEVCMQKGYGILKAAITVKYTNTFCTKLVKQNMNKQEWGCAQKYAPQAVNVTGYSCASVVIS
ncbi:unnamed protein product [Caenorhabditis angaria]|uniref:DUF19 domain-containing protein n=1 Tax=Caenorhabditis angaria TaxID=860376 RepID=A0A9P1IW49_9PELO|nr:unnamed protein product [Caenorhabditis angaria]